MKLTRVGPGPVLTPRKNVPWEKDAVLNCSACYADGKFHMHYRAVAHNPGDRNRSCIGYAWSENGVEFKRLDEPVLRSNERPEERQGVEDPRITLIGSTYHLLYTAYDGACTRVSRATSKDLLHWTRQGVCIPFELMGNNKDAALLPERFGARLAAIHRPSGQASRGPFGTEDMWISFSTDLVEWRGHKRLMTTRRGEVEWEYSKVGLAGTPHKTDAGWLVVYHAVDRRSIYRLGLALLDLNDPTKVLKRTDEPILQPEADWELAGDVDNVVFSCGSVLLGTELWVYYGGADTVIGLAKGDVGAWLAG